MNKENIYTKVMLKLAGWDFLSGNCFDFAIALHRVFGYNLALLKGYSLNKNEHNFRDQTGKEGYIFHALGISNLNIAYDYSGIVNVEDIKNGYTLKYSPEKMSYNVYKDESTFTKKLFGIKPTEAAIQKAINIIIKHPRKYFKIKEIPVLDKVYLSTNKQNSPGHLSQAQLNKLNNNSIEEALNASGRIGIWKVSRVSITSNKVTLDIGLGTSDVPEIHTQSFLELEYTEDNTLTNEQSLKNWIVLIQNIVKLGKSNRGQSWIRKLLQFSE